MILHISDVVEKKLKEVHQVDQFEILQCFENRTRSSLIETREEHKTDPPTRWFIAETDAGRRLKVVFIQLTAMDAVIRTAYEPSENEEHIYQTRSRGISAW